MAATPDTLQRAIEGDRDARSELLDHHMGTLRAYVRLRLGAGLRARESSLDLVQSVCREALEDLDRLENRGLDGFRHWLLLRAENKIKDRGRFWQRERRRGDREVRLDAKASPGEDALVLEQLRTFCTPSHHASAREELERAETAFGELPEDYRRVIVLSRVLGLAHAEVAREMERTTAATRTLLSRALARLATLLEDE